MNRRPPRSTRTDTLVPDTTLVRSGAKGDGVTSDTAPFMGCIAYQEMLGGRVTVPLGDYPVDLFINDGNLRIECEPGTILRAANTNPVVTVSDTVTGPHVQIGRATGRDRVWQ